MTEELYRLGFTIESEHACVLKWLLDVVHGEVVPRLAKEIQEGRLRLGFEPEVSVGEFIAAFDEFYTLVAPQLMRIDEARVVFITNERRAKVIRWIIDYVGAEVVPVIAELVSTGAEGWRVPFAPNVIMSVWLVVWCLVDAKFPLADGMFDLKDLEIAWELGLE